MNDRKAVRMLSACLQLALTSVCLAPPGASTGARAQGAPQNEAVRTQTPSVRTQTVAPAPDPTTVLAELVKRGATMEDIARVSEPIARTPAEAIAELKRGNARFFSGTARRPEVSAMERRAQVIAQTPFAIVIGCADSRVPTEIIYDQGLGSIFVTRVAGNIIEPGTAGSVEYAVENLKSHVVVVMGHEGCGAVKAAMGGNDHGHAAPENVRYLLDRIRPAVANLPTIRDEKARMREAVIANVRHQVAALRQNPVIRNAVARNQIAVIGAYYEITSGTVDFLETEEELRVK